MTENIDSEQWLIDFKKVNGERAVTEFYWEKIIIHELNKNLDLFAEFEFDRYDKTYHSYPQIYKTGYVLEEINKKTFLQILKKTIKDEYYSHDYFVSVRSKNDESSHYYIVVSLLQVDRHRNL